MSWRDAVKERKQAKKGQRPQGELPPTKKPEDVPAVYDSNRGGFWTLDSRKEWIQFSESSIKRLIKHKQFPHIRADNDLRNHKIEEVLIMLQTENNVSYAGSVAGYPTGLHTICGQRVLVTSGPTLLKSKEGKWKTFERFVCELLGDNARVFYGWIKAALRSLYSGPPWVPGQLLALAGPPGCGKSLLQNLITELLGNRAAKPYPFMIGDTDFNHDLITAEHLMIEDEAASTDVRTRRVFGAKLKNMVANVNQRLRRMRLDALPVTPFWRITLSVNDEPENLAVLPPIDESVKDKLTLLRCFMTTQPFSADDLKGRNAWRQRLSDELPAFMHWLRSFRVSPAMKDVRYGVKAFHDADLLQEVNALSAEDDLLSLIDSLKIWDAFNAAWVGTANELKERLLEKDKLGRVTKLLYYSSAAGTYLARLCKIYPDRFSMKKKHAVSTQYTIKPPNQ